MSIYLGNIQFDQVEKMLGYKLTEQDKPIWDYYHNDNADLSGKESSFHVFDIPRCIKFKGEDAKSAILTMFLSSKIVNPIGTFQVYEQK
jgi:hypothetical protein